MTTHVSVAALAILDALEEAIAEDNKVRAQIQLEHLRKELDTAAWYAADCPPDN